MTEFLKLYSYPYSILTVTLVPDVSSFDSYLSSHRRVRLLVPQNSGIGRIRVGLLEHVRTISTPISVFFDVSLQGFSSSYPLSLSTVKDYNWDKVPS